MFVIRAFATLIILAPRLDVLGYRKIDYGAFFSALSIIFFISLITASSMGTG